MCPYLASLKRDIWMMVYPSANTDAANKPGKLAPALCKMNNFLTLKCGGRTNLLDRKKEITVTLLTLLLRISRIPSGEIHSSEPLPPETSPNQSKTRGRTQGGTGGQGQERA